mmetsp:Transcript_56437/g.120061  ORF Transcript_56437/g.120061 Transcript_56437/m.120061 type:complete len:464 (-) Transcript_56437:56-1447(-)
MFDLAPIYGYHAPGNWSLPRKMDQHSDASMHSMWALPAGAGTGGYGGGRDAKWLAIGNSSSSSSSLPKQKRAPHTRMADPFCSPLQDAEASQPSNSNKAKSIRWVFPAAQSSTDTSSAVSVLPLGEATSGNTTTNNSTKNSSCTDVSDATYSSSTAATTTSPAPGLTQASEDGKDQTCDSPSAKTFSTYLDHQTDAPPDKVYTTLPLRGWVRCSEYVGELYPLMSIGSQLHCHGRCTPCKFYRSHRGCNDGQLCTLCHYPHWEMSYSEIRRAVKETGPSNRATLREFGFLSTSLEGMQGNLCPRANVEIENLAVDLTDAADGEPTTPPSPTGSPTSTGKLLLQCQPCSSSFFVQDKLGGGEPLLEGLYFEDEIVQPPVEYFDTKSGEPLPSARETVDDDEMEEDSQIFVRDSESVSSGCSAWSHQSQAGARLQSALKQILPLPTSSARESQASSDLLCVHYSF